MNVVVRLFIHKISGIFWLCIYEKISFHIHSFVLSFMSDTSLAPHKQVHPTNRNEWMWTRKERRGIISKKLVGIAKVDLQKMSSTTHCKGMIIKWRNLLLWYTARLCAMHMCLICFNMHSIIRWKRCPFKFQYQKKAFFHWHLANRNHKHAIFPIKLYFFICILYKAIK